MSDAGFVNRDARTSIGRELARAILVTAVIALALSSAATIGMEAYRSRSAAESSIRALADVVGTYAQPALDFDDRDAGEEALEALGRQERVVAAALFDAGGAPFASYLREGSAFVLPTVAGSPGVRWDGNAVSRLDPIGDDGLTSGFVYVRMETPSLAAGVWSSMITVGPVVVIVLLMATGAASRLRDRIARPLEQIADAAGAMERGDLTVGVAIERSDETGALAKAFGRTREGLRTIVAQVRTSALAIADETRLLSTESTAMSDQAKAQLATVREASSVVERFGVASREVRDSVDGIAATATETASSVTELSATARHIDDRMDMLFETIDEAVGSISQVSGAVRQIAANVDGVGSTTRSTGASVEVLRASVKSVEVNARQCDALSAKVSDSADQGSRVVRQVIRGMEQIHGNFQGLEQVVADLAARSEAIDEVVKVIQAVVAETNLLALNASIISSHAGEHGRAFAVVAHEIKTLAERTAGSTREIADAVAGVRTGIDDAVGAVADGAQLVRRGVGYSEEAGTALDQIREAVEHSSRMVGEIVRSTADQSSDIDAVDAAVKSLGEDVTRINVATHAQDDVARELLASVEQMRQLARDVKVATSEQSRQGSHMSQAVEEVARGVHTILESVEEQQRDIGAIVAALGVFERRTSESATRAEAMQRCSEQMSERADQLEAGVGRFRL